MVTKKPTFDDPFRNNCAVRERTGDGAPCGRCWFHLDNGDICPRHGDVSDGMRRYRETGELFDDPRNLGMVTP